MTPSDALIAFSTLLLGLGLAALFTGFAGILRRDERSVSSAPLAFDTVPVVGGYRPWLDGVRAVAVMLVLVQHTVGAMPIELGSIGVGLFFGLSGYLITSILLQERERRGHVVLTSFYIRRAARLIPALLLVVIVCDAIFILQGYLSPLKGSIAALTYTSNYVQIFFPGPIQYGPTWSLAIEEHFYVLWPITLLTIISRNGLRAALAVTLAACVAAIMWRTVLALLHAPVELLAIGTLERADALLYGCAAAIALQLGWRPRAWVFAFGAAGIGMSPVLFRHEDYPTLIVSSAFIGLASSALVVGLDYAAPPIVRRCLSLRPMVTIGVLSYGIYLWHGPLMHIVQNFAETGRNWRALAAVITVVVASVSHRYLEMPVRTSARRWISRHGERRDRAQRLAMDG
jgi:peptidoglycan/LPS O-acetylase OafA/YrhL